MESVMMIKCLCGREIHLELYGGQYQTLWQGECKCGRKWNLEEISELVKEIDDDCPEDGQ